VAVPGSDPQQWMLPMRLPERNVVLATATAQGAFAAFLSEIASRSQAGSEGLDLPSAAAPMVQAQIISAADLRNGCERSYRKADTILAGRTHDDNGLNRDQIAAITFYTLENMSVSGQVEPPVNAYYPMNVALRSQDMDRIAPFWLYIELLQGALLQLPPAVAVGGLYRGLNGPQPKIVPEEERRRLIRAEPSYWWAFTSTTTAEGVARGFARRGAGQAVLFTVAGNGCQARDIRVYSDFPDEEELLMPCGSAFAVQRVDEEPHPAPGLLVVEFQQTEVVLLQRAGAAGEAQEQQNRMFQHPALTALAELLDADETAVDFTGIRLNFRQPLPGGLLAVVLSQCFKICGERTSIWRHDLNTVMAGRHAVQPDIGIAARRQKLERRVADEAFMRGDGIAVPAQLVSEIEALRAEVSSMEAAAAAGVQLEVSIGQQGLGCVDITARCEAGGHTALCQQAVGLFKAQLDAVIADRWPGCSPQVVTMSLAANDNGWEEPVPEGIPPELVELEPEPESNVDVGTVRRHAR